MAHEINPIAGGLGTAFDVWDDPYDRRQMLPEILSWLKVAKIVGIALTAICAVAGLYAVINGMLFTALFAWGAAVVALDMSKVASNAANILSRPAMLRSGTTVSERCGVSNPDEIPGVLLAGTMVLGTCFR